MPSLTKNLVSRGILTQREVDSLPQDGRGEAERLRDLIAVGVISEEALYTAWAEYLGVPFVRLEDETVDEAVVNRLSAKMSYQHQVAALSMVEQFGTMHVKLAMANPDNLVALDDVAFTFARPVLPVLAAPGDLESFIDRHHRADSELTSLSSALGGLEQAGAASSDVVQLTEEAGSDNSPVIRFVNLLLGQAIRDRASDIHIEPAEARVRVRYRIDGVLHEMPAAPKQIQAGLISRLKIMANIDIAERRIPQDGRMAVSVSGRKIDLRVATLPTVWGEKIVMRILDQSSTTLSIGSLGLSRENLARYRAAYSKPQGMVLITGPTGSGKSTTLYSTISEISDVEVNIITVEDPVEYRLQGINQIQVNKLAGLTFASALRSILRADPDIILIGEIRDRETANIAIESALTGHMVFSTLHTNDAPSAVSRLTEMGVEPFLVGTALDAVVAQRLVRRLCERCKAPAELSPEQTESVGLPAQVVAAGKVFGPVGCSHCADTGYRGRAAVHEVLVLTDEIRQLAASGASSASIGATSREQGMKTLREDGMQKVLQGITTVEEVLRVVG